MKRIIILEGPDGGGKTTLGEHLSNHFGVPVTNHGPYKGEQQIWKHYFDSMLPAYANERDVILDRCWLAEPIYGKVYRAGLNRLELWQLRILEYVAASCHTTVVWCMPPFDRCVKAFNSRREVEMLDNDEQLYDVYSGYLEAIGRKHCAPAIVYNFTKMNWKEVASYAT